MKLKLLLIVACTHAAALAPGAVKPAPALGAHARRALSPTLSVAKELDTAALGKYAAATALEVGAITATFAAVDAASGALGAAPLPPAAVFATFFFLSLRSRVFSPLNNSRPDGAAAIKGEQTRGFNDRIMPSWTPPGVTFPIMWVLIVAPLRAYSSMLVFEAMGADAHLCSPTLLALVLHLSIGDTWNTVNNVERRLGAAVPGVACVWGSVLFAVSQYMQADPMAGKLLGLTAVWLTVAATLVTDTWRVNNEDGTEPLFPYKGAAETRFWFESEAA